LGGHHKDRSPRPGLVRLGESGKVLRPKVRSLRVSRIVVNKATYEEKNKEN